MDHRRPHLPQLWLMALLVPLVLLIVASPVWATEAPTESEEPATEQTDGPEGDVGSELGIIPVEVAPPADSTETDPQWTQRFLAPIAMLLGVLGVIGVSAFYGFRVRGRYKVVD